MIRAGAVPATAFALLFAVPVYADAVVIQSSGPDARAWPMGKIVRQGQPIRLRAGSMLKLVDKAGSWVLRGVLTAKLGTRPVETPGRIEMINGLVSGPRRINRIAAVASVDRRAAAAAPRSRGSVTAAATPSPAAARPRTGALRDAPDAPSAPPWWALAPGASGSFCFVPDRALELAPAARSGPLPQVTDVASGRTLPVNPPKNGVPAHLSADTVAAATGTLVRVSDAGGQEGTIKLLPLDRTPPDAPALARALIARGCAGQLALLADQISE